MLPWHAPSPGKQICSAGGVTTSSTHSPLAQWPATHLYATQRPSLWHCRTIASETHSLVPAVQAARSIVLLLLLLLLLPSDLHPTRRATLSIATRPLHIVHDCQFIADPP